MRDRNKHLCARRWLACVGETSPKAEACTIDNDCDGTVDEELNAFAAKD